MTAYERHIDNDDGYCTTCKAWTVEGGCEPDYRDGPCDRCGKDTVYGAEECAIMGLEDALFGEEDDNDFDAEDAAD